jgi:raffinose/stachyose/melibiose transport system substrate-binding protein
VRNRSRFGVVGVAALVAVALAGCTGGGPTSGAAGSSSSTGGGGAIKYLIAQPDTPAQLKAVKAEIKRFEQGSGVTVNLDVVPGANIRTLLQAQLRSGNGPDVFAYGPGPGMAGALAKAGLLYDLTSAYAKYKWPIYDWARPGVTYNGKLIGVPDQIEEVGLFYNKDLFAKLGLPAPTDLASLQRDAAKIKQSGVIPFAAGDKEAWEGGHFLSMALANEVGPKADAALIANKSSWNSAGVVNSLSIWSQFAKDGYLPPTPSAISYDNSNALFYSQKAAMDPTGSWLISDFDAAKLKFSVGFVPFPARSGPGIFSTDVGGGNFVSAATKNPAAAVKFLNYLTTPQHGKWEVDQYTIPAFPLDARAEKVSPLFRDVITGTSKYVKGASDVGYNIDVNETDLFNKTMYDGVQGVLSRQSTPVQVAKQLQAAAAKG